MDFDLEMPRDWLQSQERSTSAAAETSRKTRQRRKQEREELQRENEQMKRERVALLEEISSLEHTLSPDSSMDDELLAAQNALLKEELDKHKRFLQAMFHQLGEFQEHATAKSSSSMGALSQENREFAMFHFLRLLVDSQCNLQWKQPKIALAQPLVEPVELVVHYNRTSSGALNLRLDMSLHKQMDACRLRDGLSSSWEDLHAFEAAYGKGSLTLCRELQEFRVENDAEVLKAFHLREPVEDSEYRYRDMVFLSAKGTVELAKSTLDIGFSGGGQVILGGGLQQRQPRAEMLGTAQCAFAIRTFTEHGDCDEDNQAVRVLSTNLEGMFVWREQDSRTCVVWMCTLPPSADSLIGGQEEFVCSDSGRLGQRAVALFQRLLESGLQRAL